jgi:carbon storage regulator
MLVLRRRVGESILVDDVEIEIIEISRSRVKLGIRAPSNVEVIRKETLPIARENKMAVDLVASRGHDGVGELLELLNRPVPERIFAPQNPNLPATDEVSSSKPPARRYETPERYSGYRGNRENPHPA